MMKDEIFAELLERVREGSAILREEIPASRTFTVQPLDVKQIREDFRLSQSEFATILGISVKTLQNWGTPRSARACPRAASSRSPSS